MLLLLRTSGRECLSSLAIFRALAIPRHINMTLLFVALADETQEVGKQCGGLNHQEADRKCYPKNYDHKCLRSIWKQHRLGGHFVKTSKSWVQAQRTRIGGGCTGRVRFSKQFVAIATQGRRSWAEPVDFAHPEFFNGTSRTCQWGSMRAGRGYVPNSLPYVMVSNHFPFTLQLRTRRRESARSLGAGRMLTDLPRWPNIPQSQN